MWRVQDLAMLDGMWTAITAIFSLVDPIVLRGLPFDRHDGRVALRRQ